MKLLKQCIHGAAVCFGTVISVVFICLIGAATVLAECVLRLCNWVFERSGQKRSEKASCPAPDQPEP